MSGIIGIYGSNHVAPELSSGLTVLQHRGQEAAGITTYDGQRLHRLSGNGLVSDVFTEQTIGKLVGSIGLGQVRSGNAIGGRPERSEPFVLYSPYGLMIAFNGQILNTANLQKELSEEYLRFLNTGSDTEIMMHVLAGSLRRLKVTGRLKFEHITETVESVFKKVSGEYSVIAYLVGQGMLAFRSPHGTRPLVFGKRSENLQTDYMIASETVALDTLGFEITSDVRPGEVIFIDHKRRFFQKVLNKKAHHPCLFEYIYFSRPDSFLDSISVYKTRLRLGQKLSKKIKQAKLPIDVVVPIPDSGQTIGMALAEALNLPYQEGLIKNRYIGRTFIMSGSKNRQKSLRYKLNASPLILKSKNVLLADDSIIRGFTARQIVEMVREAGAKKVYFASISPPFAFACVYGINTPARSELLASGLNHEEIRRFIGVDELFFQDIKDAVTSAQEGNKDIKRFCTACFDGHYLSGKVDEKLLKEFDRLRYKPKRDESWVPGEQLLLV